MCNNNAAQKSTAVNAWTSKCSQNKNERLGLSKQTFRQLCNTWSKNVISLLSSFGYAYMWNNANVSGVILNDIVQRIKD